MAKKRSPEDVVVEWFSTADIVRVDLLFNIVRGIVKRRTPPTPRAVAARKRKTNAGAPVADVAHDHVATA